MKMSVLSSKRLIWSVTIGFALSTVLPYSSLARGSSTPDGEGVKDLTPDDLKRIAKEMDRAMKALESSIAKIPMQTYNPYAIVKDVGKDPRKLFEWVRDNTYWVPYRGSLRGHVGVLMDRLGNSLDRSLLLTELIRVSGHHVRLAHGELPEQEAKALLQKVSPVPKRRLPERTSESGEELETAVEEYAERSGAKAAILLENLEAARVRSARLAEEAMERVVMQTDSLLEMVGRPEPAVEENFREDMAEQMLESLSDHWWVQWKEGDNWVDMDPMLPEACVGQSMAAASETFVSSKSGDQLRLHSKYCHEIHIRIVVEQWSAGSIKEIPVLNSTLRPSELFESAIVLSHTPLNWPADLDLFDAKTSVEDISKAASNQEEWLPVLHVGGDAHTESAFTSEGDTFAPRLTPAGKLMGKTEQAMKGPTRVLNNLFGPSKETTKHLTAEWIEYEIRVPGESVRKIRRSVFDLIGPSVRSSGKIPESVITEKGCADRNLALLGRIDILPLVCNLSPYFVEHLSALTVLNSGRIIADEFSDGRVANPNTTVDRLTETMLLPGRVYGLALSRQFWGRLQGQVYLSQPNILTHCERIGQNPRGDLCISQEFDIVANEIAVCPGSDLSPFEVHMEYGILDTNAEALLVKEGSEPQNIAEIFARGARSSEWLVIRSSQDLGRRDLRLPDDARIRMEKDLASGYVVVLPKMTVLLEEEPVFGWWRVNPTTGDTLGFMESGKGEASVEYIVNVSMGIGLIFGIGEFFGCAGWKPVAEGTISGGKLVLCLGCFFVAWLTWTITALVLIFSVQVPSGGAVIGIADAIVTLGCSYGGGFLE